MGLSHRENKPITFIQFNGRDGLLYTSRIAEDGGVVRDAEGKVVKDSYDHVSAFADSVRIKEDEYNGEPSPKLILRMKDETAVYEVQFNASSRFAMELLGRLNNANPTEPMLVAGYVIEKGSVMPDGTVREKDKAGVTVRQGEKLDQKVTPFYGPELGARQPRAVVLLDDAGKPVKVKGVEQMDKEATAIQQAKVVADLVAAVNHRIKNGITETFVPADGGAGEEDDTIDPDEAAAAIEKANMRQRG